MVQRIAGEFGQLVEGVVDAIDIVGNPDQFKDIGKSDQDKICDALENVRDDHSNPILHLADNNTPVC